MYNTCCAHVLAPVSYLLVALLPGVNRGSTTLRTINHCIRPPRHCDKIKNFHTTLALDVYNTTRSYTDTLRNPSHGNLLRELARDTYVAVRGV